MIFKYRGNFFPDWIVSFENLPCDSEMQATWNFLFVAKFDQRILLGNFVEGDKEVTLSSF